MSIAPCNAQSKVCKTLIGFYVAGLNAIKVVADLETETKGDFTMITVRIDKAVYTDAENIADVDLETFRTETHKCLRQIHHRRRE